MNDSSHLKRRSAVVCARCAGVREHEQLGAVLMMPVRDPITEVVRSDLDSAVNDKVLGYWQCGNEPIEAKKALKHGQWYAYLKRRGMNVRVASRLMNLARHPIETYAGCLTPSQAMQRSKEIRWRAQWKIK